MERVLVKAAAVQGAINTSKEAILLHVKNKNMHRFVTNVRKPRLGFIPHFPAYSKCPHHCALEVLLLGSILEGCIVLCH